MSIYQTDTDDLVSDMEEYLQSNCLNDHNPLTNNQRCAAAALNIIVQAAKKKRVKIDITKIVKYLQDAGIFPKNVDINEVRIGEGPDGDIFGELLEGPGEFEREHPEGAKRERSEVEQQFFELMGKIDNATTAYMQTIDESPEEAKEDLNDMPDMLDEAKALVEYLVTD